MIKHIFIIFSPKYYIMPDRIMGYRCSLPLFTSIVFDFNFDSVRFLYSFVSRDRFYQEHNLEMNTFEKKKRRFNYVEMYHFIDKLKEPARKTRQKMSIPNNLFDLSSTIKGIHAFYFSSMLLFLYFYCILTE